MRWWHWLIIALGLSFGAAWWGLARLNYYLSRWEEGMERW
mgnify:CR=1 FL=1